MKNVTEILSVHRKTIKELITRKSQIEKKEKELGARVININRVLVEANNEKRQA